MDAAGGFRHQPFPAYALAADMGLQGDDDRVRRCVGRYLHWRTERAKALAEVARTKGLIRMLTPRKAREAAIVRAWEHHRRVLYHLAKAREAQRDYERDKEIET